MNIIHPYHLPPGGTWLRGNLHTHTSRSDGRCEPQDVIDDYAERGYDFLMISDHDRPAFSDELASWNSRGMILIGGNEVSSHGPHILHVHCGTKVEPHPDRQIVLDEIANDAQAFSIICHPNWWVPVKGDPPFAPPVTIPTIYGWQKYTGIEIFNGAGIRGHGSAYATDCWDYLLAAGRRVWGFANDDSHRTDRAASPGVLRYPDDTPLMRSDIAKGWNMVYCEKREPQAIVEAMRAGRFYASTGVAIDQIAVEGGRIRIEARNATRIVAIREAGRRLVQIDSCALEINYPKGAKYVRFECFGANETMAWTQPFFPGE